TIIIRNNQEFIVIFIFMILNYCHYTFIFLALHMFSDVIVIIDANSRIRISDFFEEHGIDIFQKIKDMNLEGIIAKNKYSKYIQGTRSTDWLKIKNILTQDCLVIGYTRGEGNREGYFGSL